MTVTTRLEEGVLIIAISGSLDALSCDRLTPEPLSLPSNTDTPVVLDLAGLRLLDSYGVRALFGLYDRLCALTSAVTVRMPRGQPRAVLQTLQLIERFTPHRAAA